MKPQYDLFILIAVSVDDSFLLHAAAPSEGVARERFDKTRSKEELALGEPRVFNVSKDQANWRPHFKYDGYVFSTLR